MPRKEVSLATLNCLFLYYVRVRLESEGKIATIKKRGRDLVEEMKLQTEEVLETTRIMLQKNMKDQVRW